MDEILVKKIEQKILDTISNKDDVKQLIQSLSSIDDSQSFVLGIIVGRIRSEERRVGKESRSRWSPDR